MATKKKVLLGSLLVWLSIVACAAFGLIGTTAIYFENWGEDGERTVYCASYNAASDYKNSVKFTQIELYFSC